MFALQAVNMSLDPVKFGAHKVFDFQIITCSGILFFLQGFGFVQFASPAAAANFLANPTSVSLSGRIAPPPCTRALNTFL
jgi:hypothetical protein